MKKRCERCNSEFTPIVGHEKRTRFCSRRCQTISLRHKKKRMIGIDPKYIKKCLICDTTYFNSYQKDRKYCSIKCKGMALRTRGISVDVNDISEKDEVWKKVTENDMYEVSNYGRVRSRYRVTNGDFRILSLALDDAGYPIVSIIIDGKKRTRTVHRLVSKAFIPNGENKKFVNHKDGVKTNNNVSNLEWCTCKENTDHAFKTGLRKGMRGDNNIQSRFTEKQVRQMRKLYKNGMMQKEICEIFKANSSYVSCVVNYKRRING